MRNAHINLYESTTPDTTDWLSIEWKKVEKYVGKQQKRIYSAEKEGDTHKVRNIQRMLMRSRAVVMLAVRRVTQVNKGKRTPGIDGNVVLTNKEREKLVDKIMSRKIERHKPKPAYRKYIKKKSGKKTQTSYQSTDSFFNMFYANKTNLLMDDAEARFLKEDFLPNILEYYLNFPEFTQKTNKDKK